MKLQRASNSATVDALLTYMTHGSARGSLDQLLEQERILFCCQSRLLATLWVRCERGRYRGGSLMPGHLLGACTTLNESLQICRERRAALTADHHTTA